MNETAVDSLPFLRQTLQRAFSADMSHFTQASNIPSSTCMREKVWASRIAVFHFSTAVATWEEEFKVLKFNRLFRILEDVISCFALDERA